jgi:hypothetical protein
MRHSFREQLIRQLGRLLFASAAAWMVFYSLLLSDEIEKTPLVLLPLTCMTAFYLGANVIGWPKAPTTLHDLRRFVARDYVLAITSLIGGCFVYVLSYMFCAMLGAEPIDFPSVAVVSSWAIWVIVLSVLWTREAGVFHVFTLWVDPKPSGKNVADVVASLRLRARRLRVAARFSLMLIVLSLGTGIMLFVRAGAISAKDQVYRASYVYDVQTEQIGRLNVLSQQLDSLVARQVLTSPEKDSIRAAILNQVTAPVASKPVATTNRLNDLVATQVTRVGVVLMLLFLVQILVTLYRYNMRLAAFFDARADALLVHSEWTRLPLQDLTLVFAPDNVDFGRLPPTPISSALRFSQDLISTAVPIKPGK